LSISAYIIEKIKKTPLNDLVKDSDNREIVKGAGTTFILKIIGLVFSYGFNIYFARVYGAEVMGLFALAITVAGIFSLFAQMGTQSSLMRFVAQYAGQGNYYAVKKIYKLTLQWVLPLSMFLAIIFYFLSPFIANNIFNKTKLIDPLKITAFVLPFGVLMGVNTASLRGLKKIKDAFIFSTVLPPVLNTVGLMLLTYFVFKSYLTPIYVNLITAFIGAIYSLCLWRKRSAKLPTNKNESDNIFNTKEVIKVSAPMFITTAMILIMGMTDTFMLGIFRTSQEVGVYRVVLKLALFSSFTLGAVNSIAAPKFSELYWRGEKDKLKRITKFSSKIIFFTAFPIFVLVILFAGPILSIFGDEFITGKIALIILSSGQLINVSCGLNGALFDMTGNQNISRDVMIVSAILNITLNFWFIPNYGIIGAAIATATSTIIWNLIISIYAYKIYGYWIGYYPTFGKTI